MGIESEKIRRLVWGKEARAGCTKERHQNKEKLGLGRESLQFDLVVVALGWMRYFGNRAVKVA